MNPNNKDDVDDAEEKNGSEYHDQGTMPLAKTTDITTKIN